MEEIIILELGLTEIGSPLEERSSETKRQKDKDKEKGRRKCAEELENNQDEIFLTEIYWLPAQEISVQKCFKAYYLNCGFWSNRTLLYFPLSVRPSSVRPSQAWHINFSRYFDGLYHENHIFSECISSRLVVLDTLTTWTSQTTWTTLVPLITWINWTT